MKLEDRIANLNQMGDELQMLASAVEHVAYELEDSGYSDSLDDVFHGMICATRNGMFEEAMYLD